MSSLRYVSYPGKFNATEKWYAMYIMDVTMNTHTCKQYIFSRLSQNSDFSILSGKRLKLITVIRI